MTTKNRDQAEQLIVQFLEQHEHPSGADWKRLADQHPQHASAFVDAALVRAAGDAADASGQVYSFDSVLATKTVSRALNKAHQLPSANLERAAAKVAAIRSPSVRRETAVAVGFGPHLPLLNGILAGRTTAPQRILESLASMFDVPAAALREVFARAFAASTVPAFKSGIEKPQVPSEPATWEEAVRGLALSAEEDDQVAVSCRRGLSLESLPARP